MNQRLVAAVVATPLVLALVVAAAVLPLPFATYEPGSTFNVLGTEDGSEIVQVEGHRVYRDDGELRMTTVLVSVPQQRKNIFDLARTWWDDDDAVYPYDAIYDPDQTAQQNERQGQAEMVSSQDAAAAVAMTELGYDVPARLQVSYVAEDSPADGELRVRDVLLSADGTRLRHPEDLVEVIEDAPSGEPVRIVLRRGTSRRTVEVVPAEKGDDRRIGINVGLGFDLPFEVRVKIDPAIGGPSAGLMFSLAIYDTLTPGSLTDGRSIAGTGTIVGRDGAVGPIGGIAQKIAGARDDGAELFLVPPDNCADARGADPGDMRLVRAETMHDARLAIEAWTADPDADLPTCEAS